MTYKRIKNKQIKKAEECSKIATEMASICKMLNKELTIEKKKERSNTNKRILPKEMR